MVIYADGGVQPNPGQGCWAFVCVDPHVEQCGHDPQTTNNIMEITAVIKAVEFALEAKGKDIVIYSDSQYVVKGFNEWSVNWKRNDWMKKSGYQAWEQVKNKELWQALDKYRGKFALKWVRGHAGNEYNEQADQLVKAEYQRVFSGEMKY